MAYVCSTLHVMYPPDPVFPFFLSLIFHRHFKNVIPLFDMSNKYTGNEGMCTIPVTYKYDAFAIFEQCKIYPTNYMIMCKLWTLTSHRFISNLTVMCNMRNSQDKFLSNTQHETPSNSCTQVAKPHTDLYLTL
jgi:hypothetical protein